MKKHRVWSLVMAFVIGMSCTAFGAEKAAFGDSTAGNHPAAPYAESEIIVPRPESSVYATPVKYSFVGIPSDIKGHWAEKYMMYFLQNGAMKAENGKLYPNTPVTYAEFAQVASRLGLHPVEFNGGAVSYKIFDDYAFWNREHPDAKAALICAEAGIWGNPYKASAMKEATPSVRLGDAMQRQYLAAFLVNFLNADKTVQSENRRYRDLTEYRNSVCRNAMFHLAEERIITPYTDNTLRPKNPVTRAEMAVMLYRVLEKSGFDMNAVSDHLYGNYHRYFWEQEERLLELVNAERAAAGSRRLVYDADLNALCTIKMLEKSIYGNDTFHQMIQYDGKTLAAGHVSQFYGRATEMARTFGLSEYYVGENAVKSSQKAEEAHRCFYGSEAHRKNYLKAEYEVAGFAIGGAMTYEMFAYLR